MCLQTQILGVIVDALGLFEEYCLLYQSKRSGSNIWHPPSRLLCTWHSHASIKEIFQKAYFSVISLDFTFYILSYKAACLLVGAGVTYRWEMCARGEALYVNGWGCNKQIACSHNTLHIAYAAVYHCNSIHISIWLKINYNQRFYPFCMIHDLKFSSDIMFSDPNGKSMIFFRNACLKWPK